MINPETILFCRLDGLTVAAREQQRLEALTDLGLLEAEAVPVFEEATQTAAHFLQAPICILSLMTRDWELLKSSVGLSRLGLMNALAISRRLPRSESFCTYVVDSHQVLAIVDTLANPLFADSSLVQQYGIRSYLGIPLLTASGHCLGTLAVMDLLPRTFTNKEIEFLAITARWSLSEFERNYLLKKQQIVAKSSLDGQYEKTNGKGENIIDEQTLSATLPEESDPFPKNSIKVKLLTQLAQELRTPLTAVMGMTSVLSREVYGSLNDKQKEYLEIIHDSGQHLVSLVDEILALEVWNENSQTLNAVSVDIEMLCQQATNSLIQMAKQRQQQIRLSVEPGNHIWFLDKEKVRQMIYYLVVSVIYSAEVGSVIRIHVSRKNERLNLAVWVSHPWLGDGLPQISLEMQELASLQLAMASISHDSDSGLDRIPTESQDLVPVLSLSSEHPLLSSPSVSTLLATAGGINKTPGGSSRESLGLLFSCQLAEINGGRILVQGSLESGYRYVVSLPQLTLDDSPCANKGKLS